MVKRYVKYQTTKKPRYLIQLGLGKILGWSHSQKEAVKKAKKLAQNKSGKTIFVVKEVGFVDTHTEYP